jgi:uncharacterized protein (TIGR04255 family)
MPAPSSSPSAFFPVAERVVYDKSPLTEVVCQLRFPTLLRIEGEVPSAFQEAVRGTFPLFERQSPQILGLPPQMVSLPPDIMRAFGAATQQAAAYNFKTEDSLHTITLTPDFLALTSKHYERWEIFTEMLNRAVEALKSSYQPSFYTRIGLRYQNLIEPSVVGANERPWSELLSHSILGEFQNEMGGEFVFEEALRQLRLRSVGEKYGILLQHGLGVPKALGERAPYIIDTDVYADQKTEVADASSVLDRFNAIAGRVFRWCISDQLHSLLGPRPAHRDDPSPQHP